jgi:hypothetical protein
MRQRPRLSTRFVAVTTTMMVCGCGGGGVGDESSPTQGAAPIDVTPEQQAFFDDGVVTLEEYQAGFAAFQTCARELGSEVIDNGRDLASGVISYATSQELLDPASGQINETTTCYRRHFAATELEFQLSDPAALDAAAAQQLTDFQELNAPCLIDNGVAVPPDLEVGSQAYQALLTEFNELALAGQCEGVTAVPVP